MTDFQVGDTVRVVPGATYSGGRYAFMNGQHLSPEKEFIVQELEDSEGDYFLEGIDGGSCSYAHKSYILPVDHFYGNKEEDTVGHPAHYTRGGIEVWDFIADQDLNYFRGNAVKYLTRAGHKDAEKELEDLQKARAYVDKEIERLHADRG